MNWYEVIRPLQEAFNWYRKRFRIETLFSDLKGRGFNLQKSGLRAPERVSRLIIAAILNLGFSDKITLIPS
jgi:hypothetical protein